METICIDNPPIHLSKGSKIRFYENLDIKLFDIIDELNKTTPLKKYTQCIF